ncbi:hypothetical protein WJX72_009104 [[Myrmecia] bisecta]|uniref:Uncharacterized protein n=1 Tax=[Myrmecia] bisecta TaxID=41462 RepID=A0AAW1QS46_9CHLO
MVFAAATLLRSPALPDVFVGGGTTANDKPREICPNSAFVTQFSFSCLEDYNNFARLSKDIRATCSNGFLINYFAQNPTQSPNLIRGVYDGVAGFTDFTIGVSTTNGNSAPPAAPSGVKGVFDVRVTSPVNAVVSPGDADRTGCARGFYPKQGSPEDNLLSCPAGYRLAGFELRNGEIIDAMAIWCQII